MKITETQLRQIIRQEAAAINEVHGGFGVQEEDLLTAADAASAALQELLDQMVERQTSLAHNGDGSRGLDLAIKQVEDLMATLDGVEYLQRREKTGSDFSGESTYAPLKRRR